MQRDLRSGSASVGDLSGVQAIRAIPRHPGRRLSRRLSVVAALAAAALATYLGLAHRPAVHQAIGEAQQAVGVAKPVARPAWVTVPKAEQWFTLQAAAIEGLPRTYAVRRETDEDAREDILTFGTPGGDKVYLRLAIRRSDRGSPDADLFAALVRRAAEANLAVSHAGAPFLIPTRLGPFEATAVTLAADARSWDCLGVRLKSTDTRLRIQGFACGGGGKTLEPSAAACLMDWLDLAADTYDPVLKNFFAEADRRRGSACTAPRSIADALNANRPSSESGTRAKPRHPKKRSTTAAL